jgi:hypothetical protein
MTAKFGSFTLAKNINPKIKIKKIEFNSLEQGHLSIDL